MSGSIYMYALITRNLGSVRGFGSDWSVLTISMRRHMILVRRSWDRYNCWTFTGRADGFINGRIARDTQCIKDLALRP